jgi:hydrogenase 3 maturation protease
MAYWRDDCRAFLSGRVALVGVGNRLRGDDAFGPLVIDRVQDTVPADCFDCASTPENWLSKIEAAAPDTILALDIADFGGEPGELRLLRPDQLGRPGASTHGLSHRVWMELLSQRANAPIQMLAVQPIQIQLGSPVSEPVARRVEEVVAGLQEILAEKKP